MEDHEREALIEAVNDVLFQTYLPLIFTPEQIEEMKQPYHSIYDHLSTAHISTLSDGIEALGYFKPQLQLSDPRIDEAVIETLPKTIDVEFGGATYTMPVRVFAYNFYEDKHEWRTQMDNVYRFREIAETLADGISRKFNLVAGTDYDFGMGQDVDGQFLSLQIMSDDAKEHSQRMVTYVEEQLDVIPGHDIKKAMAMGPMRRL